MRYGVVILLCLAVVGIGIALKVSAYKDCRSVGMSTTSCLMLVSR